MISERNYHSAFGSHSNIPGCCIAFFIDEWEKIWNTDGGLVYRRALDAANAGYIQCPQCLGHGIKARLKICAIECGGDHQEDFRC